MKTTIETTEGKVLVTFEGILDSYIAEEVGEQLVQLYELEDTEITLDCTKLEYIASSGLRLFLLLLRNTKANGCKIFIKGAASELMDIFKATGFDKCFQFV
jgi:anti-anti-sigma factor